MGFLKDIINHFTSPQHTSFNNKNGFDLDEYNKYNTEKIREFKNKYDLSNISVINNIPPEEAEKFPDGGKSVVYMPEQILNRQATEYKKDKKFDLAIACLKKANEMYPFSYYSYLRDDYERLVDMMVLAGKFDEAKKEHKRLDMTIGTKLSELKVLQKNTVSMGKSSFERYQKEIIDPYLDEYSCREQYYWLLENLSELAPKSFNGYRRMKNSKTENYKKIVEAVKRSGKEIDCLKFWD